jgi:dihydrofolate synthase/folylpolyglutamate synthase
VPLPGRHQLDNAAAAVGLADSLCEKGLTIGDEAVRHGLASVDWPGRIQRVADAPETIIDGAHNPASVAALVAVLDGLPRRRTVFVVGIAADKNIPEMLELLAPRADEFIFTATGNPRAATPEQLEAMLRQIDASVPAVVAIPPVRALETAAEVAAPADRVCVTGSMYLAGEALKLLSAETA